VLQVASADGEQWPSLNKRFHFLKKNPASITMSSTKHMMKKNAHRHLPSQWQPDFFISAFSSNKHPYIGGGGGVRKQIVEAPKNVFSSK
jgi:hypothetical protein